mmetsp:Transcript_26978/g.63349  ORF Transcript_26978/g.63349 Transcript_26978/m.63349 type:complete len:282 (+) Transcript_26978:506-1351(+)
MCRTCFSTPTARSSLAGRSGGYSRLPRSVTPSPTRLACRYTSWMAARLADRSRASESSASSPGALASCARFPSASQASRATFRLPREFFRSARQALAAGSSSAAYWSSPPKPARIPSSSSPSSSSSRGPRSISSWNSSIVSLQSRVHPKTSLRIALRFPCGSILLMTWSQASQTAPVFWAPTVLSFCATSSCRAPASGWKARTSFREARQMERQALRVCTRRAPEHPWLSTTVKWEAAPTSSHPLRMSAPRFPWSFVSMAPTRAYLVAVARTSWAPCRSSP